MMEAASTATTTAADPSRHPERILGLDPPPQPARIPDDAAARRLRGHCHGALVLRSPTGPAAGDRPEVVRRDGGRRGLDRGGAPRRPGRHPRPQRHPARRLGRGTDDRRGPGVDAAGRPRAGEVPRRPARHRLLRDPGRPARHRQPLRVRRPPGPLDPGHRRPGRGRRAGLRGAVHAPGPGPGLPGRGRRGQPGRLPRHPGPRGGRTAAGRLRAHLRQAAVRHRRLGALPGQRGEPDPARGQHHRQGRRRPGPAHHARRRPAVVRPARRPPGRRGRPRRLGARDRHGRPHR